MQDRVSTPQKANRSEMQSTQKNTQKNVGLPGDAESVVMSALMEKAKFSRINESFHRSRSTLGRGAERRAPSTELKQCLRNRGFVIEGDKPVFKKFNA